jgi:hypothetical protein
MKRNLIALAAVCLLGAGLGAAVTTRAADKPAAAGAPAPAPAAAPKPAHSIVLCAPGYPGNTVQAQPAMDAFARAVEKTAGLPPGSLGAAYYETEGAGIERLRQPDVVLALTTIPFFLQDGGKAGLAPRLSVVRNGSPTQQWSLIAKKGRVGGAADMDGWELTGPAGYAPGFVQALLVGWGPLRSSTKITFTPAPLGALRRVVDGESLAVLLEPEQVQALFPKNPLANDLEIVATSKPVPGSVVCAVKGRMDEAAVAKILDAFMRLPSSPDGAEALKTLRIDRFATLDPKALAWLQHAPAGDGTLKK